MKRHPSRGLPPEAERDSKRQRCEILIPDVWPLIFSKGTLRDTLRLSQLSSFFYKLVNDHIKQKYSHLCCSSDHFLPKFTHLTTLVCSTTVTYRSVSLLTNLKSLSLQSYLPTFSTLTNLEKLQVLDILPVSSLFPLSRLTSLSAIQLIGYRTLGSQCLSAISHLRRLSLDLVDGELLDLLTEVTSLTSLRIQKCDFPREKIQQITKISNLRDLRIYDQVSVESLIPGLPNLLSLDCLHQNDTQILSCLSNLLKYRCCGRSFEHLSIMTNLRSLNLGWSTVSFDVLQKLSNLTRLKNLVAVGPAELLPTSLKTLVSYSPGLCLSLLTNLTKLEVNAQIDSKNFSCLSNLTELVHGTIHNPEIILSLPQLPNLRQLAVESVVVPDEIVAQMPWLLRLSRKSGFGSTAGKFDIDERMIFSEDDEDSEEVQLEFDDYAFEEYSRDSSVSDDYIEDLDFWF